MPVLSNVQPEEKNNAKDDQTHAAGTHRSAGAGWIVRFFSALAKPGVHDL
jgi:hypothetical protein